MHVQSNYCIHTSSRSVSFLYYNLMTCVYVRAGILFWNISNIPIDDIMLPNLTVHSMLSHVQWEVLTKLYWQKRGSHNLNTFN